MEMMFSFVVFFCFVARVYAQLNIGDSCTTKTGSTGTCAIQFECSEVPSDEAPNDNITLCAWQEFTPIVCCAKGTGPVTSSLGKIPVRNAGDSTTTTLSPGVQRSFECFLKYLSAIVKLSKPKQCHKTGISDIIEAAALDNAKENMTLAPFGTHKGRIAKVQRNVSYSEEKVKNMRRNYNHRDKSYTFERPEYNFVGENRPCGYVGRMPVVKGSIGGMFYPVYFLNWTVQYLVGKGYVTEVMSKYQDAVDDFLYWNLTFCGRISFDYVDVDDLRWFEGGGGIPSSRARAAFMALVGEKSSKKKTRWDCDGVLINSLWVLSAAHCFIDSDFKPNYVRLGEYDLSENVKHFESNFPHDLGIKRVIFHPEFDPRHRYHDLVLLQLEKPAPLLSHDINPICLPWTDLGVNFISKKITLTGWGATKYLSTNKSNILQEVSVTVFDPTFCSINYMSRPDFYDRWPQGINGEKILCAGDKDGGKDACQGDSGAPLVYFKSFEFRLAAIVSGGYGCGLKNYPGIYIPINRPRYLNWIKRVAFDNKYHLDVTPTTS